MARLFDPDSIAELRRQVLDLSRAGRYHAARERQVLLLDKIAANDASRAAELARLGTINFALQEFDAAVAAFRKARSLAPDDPVVVERLGLGLARAGHFPEALVALKARQALAPASPGLLEALAEVYGRLGDLVNARRFGERALVEKDALSRHLYPGIQLRGRKAPPFRPERRHRNVIAFSLPGGDVRQIDGAIRNAELMAVIYPDWQARFYCAIEVPADVRRRLAEAGAEVIAMPAPARPQDGIFWRLLAAEDPNVDFFQIRDCVPIINVRERVAVDDWLMSGRLFHIMRDHYSHAHLIVAGLWGGVARHLPALNELLAQFRLTSAMETSAADQAFLDQLVWPLVKENAIIHDRIFRVLGAGDFPPYGALAPGRHIGESDGAGGVAKDAAKPGAEAPGSRSSAGGAGRQ